jgi:hypothetical protein
MKQSEHLRQWRHENYQKRKEEINANRRDKYAVIKDDKNEVRREKYSDNKDSLNEKRRDDYQVHKPRILKECHKHYEKHKDEISEYGKIHYQKNKDEIKERTGLYYENNKDKLNARKREYRLEKYEEIVLPQKQKYYFENKDKNMLKQLELKTEVMTHYGKDGKCACARCGINDIRVLTIDHINGDGYKERSSGKSRLRGSSLYLKIKKDEFPINRYQTLCFNCQKLKQMENHEYSGGQGNKNTLNLPSNHKAHKNEEGNF